MIIIGVLNIMHDKLDTQKRIDHVMGLTGKSIRIHYFYPVDHYLNCPVPKLVKTISDPLTLSQIKDLDGFIITGAPIERLDFDQVTYIKEIHRLLNYLDRHGIEQLYICWGAMAALNYFYHINKHKLPHKLFGVYQHRIYHRSPLINGLSPNFVAPHARYEEMNHSQIQSNKNLSIISSTNNGKLFLVENLEKHQTFLFAHLEYGPDGLLNEYEREVKARPDQINQIEKPHNYLKDFKNVTGPTFKWAHTQRVFFKNWIKLVINNGLRKK